MRNSIIEQKTFDFAIKIVKLHNKLISINERTLSNQLLRSGTSIGANVAEGERGQTKADFLAKMNVALKEANETMYWIKLLYETGYLSKEDLELLNELDEIIAILVAITKNKN